MTDLEILKEALQEIAEGSDTDPQEVARETLDAIKSRKLINYDFNIDTLITVEAPVGTDPNTLIEKAITKLRGQVNCSDITLSFDQCFDAETGNYTEDWKDGFNEGT